MGSALQYSENRQVGKRPVVIRRLGLLAASLAIAVGLLAKVSLGSQLPSRPAAEGFNVIQSVFVVPAERLSAGPRTTRLMLAKRPKTNASEADGSVVHALGDADAPEVILPVSAAVAEPELASGELGTIALESTTAPLNPTPAEITSSQVGDLPSEREPASEAPAMETAGESSRLVFLTTPDDATPVEGQETHELKICPTEPNAPRVAEASPARAPAAPRLLPSAGSTIALVGGDTVPQVTPVRGRIGEPITLKLTPPDEFEEMRWKEAQGGPAALAAKGMPQAPAHLPGQGNSVRLLTANPQPGDPRGPMPNGPSPSGPSYPHTRPGEPIHSVASLARETRDATPKYAGPPMFAAWQNWSVPLGRDLEQLEQPQHLPPTDRVTLASYYDEPEPIPSPVVDNPLEAKTAGIKEDDKLGQAPASNTLQFLRRQTPLLAQGMHQLDLGFSYSFFNNDIPVYLQVAPGPPPVFDVVRARQRNRLFYIPMEFRYGVTDRIQAFVGMPLIGWANSEIAYANVENHADLLGLGDLRGGFNALVRQGCGTCPDVVSSFFFTAPTGNPGNPLVAGINPANRLGEGFWSVGVNLLLINTFDPVVIFYGAGYRHRFANVLSGALFTPGEEFNYQFGVGFAINPTVTLSGSFQGSYISQWQLDRQWLAGSVLEFQRMRFAITMVRNCKIVEPFAEIGMTPNTPWSRIGITWTF